MSLLKIPRRGGWRHRGLGWERRGRGPRALLTPLRPPHTRLRVRLAPLCATAVLTPKGPALGHPRMCREPWQGAPGFQPPCSPCESGPTAPAPQGRGTPAPLAHPSAVPRGHWGAWGGFPGCCSTPELRITLRAPQVVAGGASGTLTHGPLPPTMWGSALWKKPEKILCLQVMSSLVREGIHLCDGGAVGNRGTALEKISEKSIKSTQPPRGVQAAAAGASRARSCHHALSCATCKPRAQGFHHNMVLPQLFPPFSSPRLFVRKNCGHLGSAPRRLREQPRDGKGPSGSTRSNDIFYWGSLCMRAVDQHTKAA